jgi:hypothetical protein
MLARVNFFEGTTEGAEQATWDTVWLRIRDLEGYRGYIVTRDEFCSAGPSYTAVGLTQAGNRSKGHER